MNEKSRRLSDSAKKLVTDKDVSAVICIQADPPSKDKATL